MAKWDKEYLKLCRKILTEGVEVENRTGINTIKISDFNFRFNVGEEFPVLSTKQLFFTKYFSYRTGMLCPSKATKISIKL